MLTADLVRTRKKGTELAVVELSSKLRPRALELAARYLTLAEGLAGATRAELEEAFAQVEVAASEQKLALGLRKLVEDRIEFTQSAGGDPQTVRRTLFERAAAERRALADGQRFEREALLLREAEGLGLSVEVLMKTLYADLRQADVMVAFQRISADGLVTGYDLAQKQAVLLRAVDVVADVRCRDAYVYRTLFRKLKFFRLMHRIEARSDGGYRLFIDGPFSLFGASTKYGLQLALALPYLLACDEYKLCATLRWGKERVPLTFKLEGRATVQLDREDSAAHLPDEVALFRERFATLGSAWEVSVSSVILAVPGAGLCVPDLRFIHRETGEVAYLEVLGFWSRDAVWKRVDLVSRGLKERVLFAASSRLRVSEEALSDDAPAQLVVYKGSLSAKEVLRRLSVERSLRLSLS